jgi:chitodextrinase
MKRKRLLAVLATSGVAIAGAAAAIIPMTVSNAAEACAGAYSASAVYTSGNKASHQGKNWTARWWTQGEAPSTGGSGVWQDNGACGGGSGGGGGGNGGGNPPISSCNHPAWVPQAWYDAGAVVRYTNGQYYRAKHANPGYDPTISTWYWEPFTCSGNGGGGNGGGGNGGGGTGDLPLTEAQFNSMFPSRLPIYTYAGLAEAAKKYPEFARYGDTAMKRREMAAFLANINHESGQLRYVEEINQANWPHYCQPGIPDAPCVAGRTYHGRGPIQLSWNFNYKAAGHALGLGDDLLKNPDRVKNESWIAWGSAIWYWMTQKGPGTMTPHEAIVNKRGFGETIRSINGAIECRPGVPQVAVRVGYFRSFVAELQTDVGEGRIDC